MLNFNVVLDVKLVILVENEFSATQATDSAFCRIKSGVVHAILVQ